MLNFNVAPYHDDFDPNKNYHRVLFRPGKAVQARELTQAQTILQDQISKFADHIFKQNTPVKGGQVTVNGNNRYLKLNSTYNDIDVVASDFLNKVISDSTGTITAKVVAFEETTGGDPPTLILTYYSGREFSGSDIIYDTDSNLAAQVAPVDFTGYATTASISEGVFYIVNGYAMSDETNQDGSVSRYSIGNFVTVQPQTIIVQKYGNTPTRRIGLTISEYVSDYISDPSLLDPAIGASNYQAPGADRYTITLTLDSKPIELGNDSGFIELVRITDGKLQRMVDGTVYSVIDDYFAKRTYDTNGDFIVNDFRLITRANTSNSGNYQLQIGTGVAYVKGYRVENTGDLVLEAPRARTTQTVNNNTINVDYGSYLYVNGANGVFDVAQVVPVDFHCVNVASSIATTNTTTYNSTKVGSGYIRALSYDTNTSDSNTATYIYKAYVSDIQNNVLSSNVTGSATTTTIQFFDTTGKFSSAANAYYGVSLTLDSGTSAGDSRKIVSYNGATKTATVDSPFTQIPTTSTTFSLRFNTKDIDLLTRPTSTSTYDAFFGVDPKGKVGGLSIGETTLFNSQSPELIFDVGYDYVSNMTDTTYTSTKVSRGVSFTTTTGGVSGIFTLPTDVSFVGTGGTTQSADVAKANFMVVVTNKGSSSYNVGDVISFTGSNTITLDSGKGTATFFVAGASSFTATIIAKVSISNANSTSLTLKAKNLVKANTTAVFTTGTAVGSVSVNLTNGQVYIPLANVASAGAKQSLYVCDVKKIVKIIDTKSSGTAASNAMLTDNTYDVTANYAFDNGQKDSYYGHASITLRPGAPKAQGNLLVLFDYYQHSGGDGYFSVNSYRSAGDGGVSSSPESYADLPSYTAKNGTVYNLRDCVDFRLSTNNAVATETFRYSTPITSTNSAGLYIPTDLSSFVNDYTHYLGRKDCLVLSRDTSFQLLQGRPSANPVFPTIPEGSLLVAKITLDPYTAYLPDEVNRTIPNISLEKIQHKRWAMSDISDLQTRVNNIEYYTSLSLLEKQAEALQVPDSNGLNRFKNGILVDNFTSFSTADTGNADYAAKVNKRRTVMTATDHVINARLEFKDGLNSLGNLSEASQTAGNYKYHSISGGATNIITLPYTTANLVVQSLASNTVSLNPFAVAVAEGTLDINPPMDNWVSTSRDPDMLLVDPNIAIYQQGSTLNQLSASDWQTISGTQTVSTTMNGTIQTISTYVSQAQQVTSGYYDRVNSLNNSYITDVSLQPYIRGQQLVVKAKGMKINTPVSIYFDGVNVNRYMIQPNIVELTSVTGTFKEGDIVGYFSAGVFTPTARVIQATNLSSNKTRLYLTSDNSSTFYTNNNVLQNAVFNSNGTYSTFTASGQLSNTVTQLINTSGKVSAATGSSTTLFGGGTYYTSVSSLTLGAMASNQNNFYVGSTIRVTSYRQIKETQQVVVGRTPTTFSSGAFGIEGFLGGGWSFEDIIENRDVYRNVTQTFTATITAYNGTTKVATLSTPIEVSLGNNNVGGTTVNIDSTYSINGTTFLVSQAATQSNAPTLSTDEFGNFSGIFAIPSNTFKTGERILRIDNRTAENDPNSATTFAQGTFTASSLATRSQALNFGASITSAGRSTVFTRQSRRDNILVNQVVRDLSPPQLTPFDPIAQSFIIDKATYPNGTFLKSIKVFFQSKPSGAAAVPVKLFIVDTVNGYPEGTALDYSVVVKTAQEINVSNTPHYLDPTTYTEFVFEAPVYVKSGNLYAFILQTTTPDYTVWTAAQNSVAVASSVKNLPTDPTPSTITKIGGSPYVGALFESQNAITWSADQTKNMMFTIENCIFNTAANPGVQLIVPKRIPLNKMITSDIDYYKNANTVNNIYGNFYGNDLRSDAYNVSVTDFIPTQTNISYSITPTLQSTYTSDETRNITPGKYGTTSPDHIYLDDGKGPRVLDANSNTAFIMTASFSSNDQFVSPILSDDGTNLFNIKYNINNLGISNTNVIVTNGGSGYANAAAVTVTISEPTGLGGTRAYATANVVGGIVDAIYITTPGSGYIETPTITISGANTTPATATIEGETSAKGGNAWARYITKKVVLTPENDSEDLRAFYTAFKPLGSNIHVYYKLLNRNDTEKFEDQPWKLMTHVGQGVNGYSRTRDDLIEFVAAPGTAGIADNQVKFTSTNGTTYTQFAQFAIKIVLSTSDTTKVPEIHDLRVLALPTGTGV